MIAEERIVTMIDNHIAEYYPQRKLIRCKDCKAFNGLKCVRNNMIAVRSYDWCSRAERKEK